jgi:large subunit ribosomal protein L21
MTHAIFETGGKQYRVKEGDELYIEKLDAEVNAKVKFDQILAILSEDNSTIGNPYIKGATVTAKVLKSGRAKKIIVFKMLRRKGYRRKQGHRQPYTKVVIEKIATKSTEKATDTKKDVKETKAAENTKEAEVVTETKAVEKKTTKTATAPKTTAPKATAPKATATKTAAKTAPKTEKKPAAKTTTKTTTKAVDKSKED